MIDKKSPETFETVEIIQFNNIPLQEILMFETELCERKAFFRRLYLRKVSRFA